ncbi:MAG: hypothetical protein NW201_14585, partial [Gemmatimonadales bacterium]|nr:hypothetical protein [Gemmatimonadales bacterium]
MTLLDRARAGVAAATAADEAVAKLATLLADALGMQRRAAAAAAQLATLGAVDEAAGLRDALRAADAARAA